LVRQIEFGEDAKKNLEKQVQVSSHWFSKNYGGEHGIQGRKHLFLMLLLIQYNIYFDEVFMRTTVTINDELYKKALEFSDPNMDKSDIFREAINVFIRVQAAKRLAALGGTSPEIKNVPRQREI
jgi:hypothetical protein